MKKQLILLVLSIMVSITTQGQNFVFIGESSYPSTEQYSLESNSDKENINDEIKKTVEDNLSVNLINIGEVK